MHWKRKFAIGCGIVLGGMGAAQAQAPLPYRPGAGVPLLVQAQPAPAGTSGVPQTVETGTNVSPPPATREAMQTEQANQPEPEKLGPTPVDKVGLLQGFITGDTEKPALKFYGWLDFGYTYSSTGPGLLNVAPRMNRFGNELLLNQLAIRIEKPLDPKELSWGFNVQAYGGADPALLNPTAGALITNPDPRFGFDFSDLNLTAHLPVLTEGGIDVKAGRQTTVLGSQAAQAPWRTFYSSDYQWFYAEEGRFTGVTANWHVNKRLDWYNGIEFGWGTFFDQLTVAPTYITQVNYYTDDDKKTLLTGTVVTGPETLVKRTGQNTTVVEGRITENWNEYFTQILQTHLGYSKNGLGNLGLERFYSLYLYNIYHYNKTIDFNTRLEWYDDVDGHGYPGGTGIKNNYYEATMGVNYHPVKYLEFRPELRGDYAGNRAAFGPVGSDHLNRSQLTAAIDCLFKF